MVSPINWLITGFLETSTGLNKKILVKTDVEVYLTCFVSLTDPEPHLVVRYQRGVRTWCTTKPAKVLWMKYPQTEYADTIYHTFMLPGPLLNLKHWIRFEGTFLGIPTISNSPIFERTERTYWEPWNKGLTGYHPWAENIFGYGFIEFSAGWIKFSTNLLVWGPCTITAFLSLTPYPTSIFPHVPHYLLDCTLPGEDRTPPIAYIQIAIGPIIGWEWYLRYDYVSNLLPPWPKFGLRRREGLIGWGQHTIDLHHDLAELAAYSHASYLTPESPIVAIRVTVGYNASPPWYQNLLAQDYIDFLDELPE